MAKKEKVIDLTPKAEKITEDQLKKLQDTVTKVNRSKMDLGQMEMNKHHILHGLADLNDSLLELQEEFKKEYNTINIDINDGTINYPSDEQINKED